MKTIKGMSGVLKKFDNVTTDIVKKKSRTAMFEILLTGAREAHRMTPVDTNTLANSQYAPQITERNGQLVGTVGYHAEYAGYVHDAKGTLKGQPRATGNGNYWDPEGEPKFLEKGFNEIMPDVPNIINHVYRLR